MLKMSTSGNLWLMGTENGIVRICQRSDKENQLFMPYWERRVHDGQYGKVTGIGVSSDNLHLLSVSSDSTFYVQVVLLSQELHAV